jgi:hypothetical protein
LAHTLLKNPKIHFYPFSKILKKIKCEWKGKF